MFSSRQALFSVAVVILMCCAPVAQCASGPILVPLDSWVYPALARLSALGYGFIKRILSNATDLCLILNGSVNAYRRLDPHFEAPNQIRSSPVDRGAMIRIPLNNERSARIEVRSVGPDANPYMVLYALLRTGLEGPLHEEDEAKRPRTRFLPDNVHDALRHFKAGDWAVKLLGKEVHARFADLKQESADRCPKALGSAVKVAEIQFHHEVTNQHLWNLF